ncbi:MAG: hypothetical protein ABIF18_02360 [archaeon]
MARKKVKEKKKKGVVKLTESDKISSEEDKQLKNEDRQLLWFFIIIGIIFATVLVSYFGAESLKSFEYAGVDWMIEDYENLRIYHGMFIALNNANLNYNIFLRGDPRENDVPTEGTFDKFKYGGIISITPEVDRCRGELSRVMLDLGAFLKQGVGVGPLTSGSTDESVANESGRRFAQCGNVHDRALVIIELGASSVTQDRSNPYCYIIRASDCNDVSSVERFMVKTIEDFTFAKKALEESGKLA